MKFDFVSPEIIKKGRDFFKKYKYLLLVAAVGVVLTLLPTGGKDPPTNSSSIDAVDELAQNVEQLEKKITQALQSIKGVGEAGVVLTLKSGTQTVYAIDTRQNSAETVVVSVGSGVQQPVVSVKNYPTFQGALVVCDGADSPSVRLEVTRAVSALTGLSADRITVSKRSGAK